MKISILVLSVFGLLNATSPARADLVTELNITADYYPGNQYAVGFDIDSNHLINRVYFENSDGNKDFWTLDELSTFQPVFTIAGKNVVNMRIASHSGNQEAVIELQYVTNALTGSTQSLFFECRFNATTSQYEIVDKRNNQVIHHASATTHYGFLHVPIGIAAINTN